MESVKRSLVHPLDISNTRGVQLWSCQINVYFLTHFLILQISAPKKSWLANKENVEFGEPVEMNLMFAMPAAQI